MSEVDELRATLGAPLITAFDRYIATVPEDSRYTATRYVVPAALKAAGDDAVAFEALLAGIAAVMARKDDHRFYQQAVPVSGTALAGRPVAMRAILDGALRLAETDTDPGWFV
ncbi:MAG TPA: hypothetical protein VGC41_07945, partial [Kofleriaceae bacterium]